MEVLLLTSISRLNYQVIPDLGLMYVAAAARRAGHSVSVRDCRREGLDLAGLERVLSGSTAQVIGIKSYSNEAARVAEMARVVRRTRPDAVIIIGGPHPSMDPEAALKLFDAADYVMAGEGEIGFPDLLEKIETGGDLPAVPGLGWRDGGAVRVNPVRLSDDLDALPPPAWDLMPPNLYPDEAAGIFVPAFPAAPMLLSRGCPQGCAYCGCRRISGSRIRYRGAASIIEEIDRLERDYGVRTFTFVDDNFTCSRERAMELFTALAARPKKIAFTFPNGVRADSLDEEMVRAMEAAGCYSLALGVESGSDETLKRMNKRQTVAEVRKQVEMIRRAGGIRVTGFFILGYPGETLADVRNTIAFAASLPIHHAHFCLFIPIPGTRVHRDLLEQGMVSALPDDYENLTIDKPSVELPGLPSRQLLRLHQWAYIRFYLNPGRAWNLLGQLKSPGHLRLVLRRFAKLFV